MTFNAKKLLLILQLNEALLYLKNHKSKIKDFQSDMYKIKYDEEINNFGVLYRNGKQEFIEYLFNIDRQKIDVGVWTNFDSNITQILTQKYFGRYYRDLLFVLPTNRGLYTSSAQPQDNIKIPKQLNAIYSKFAGYNSTNTLMLTTTSNTIAEHTKNDMMIPPFGPKYPGFEKDIGCFAVSKYVRGVVYKLAKGELKDVRILNTGKPLNNLFNRFSHRTFNDTTYI